MNWSIDGADLETKPRKGGSTAEKGFTFQKAYALVRLTWLPTGERGLVELRYEGAQDVDLKFKDGGEVLVQAKDLKPGTLGFGKLKEIVAGFARDLITAVARGRQDPDVPKFRLVCTSSPYEESSYQVLRRVYVEDHAREIQSLIGNDYSEGLAPDRILDCVTRVLMSAEFEILVHADAADDLRAQAAWNLVRFGVPPEHVEASLDRLQSALVPRATFQVSEVVDCLVGLPEGHPGRDGAACRLLPARKNLEMTPLRRNAFLQGAASILWAAVANGLDVERPERVLIRDALVQTHNSGGMIVVEGMPGSGKSALIRKIAWDAHAAGTHLVLDVWAPSDLAESNWIEILRLHRLSARPVILVVDDIWRHASFVEALNARVKPGLCVLASSRPGEASAATKMDLMRLAVYSVVLGSLSDEFVSGLQKLVGRQRAESAGLSPGQVTRFIETGQLLALSLTLQGGSLELFAKGVLRPLRQKPSFDSFIDLCIIGRYDSAVPQSLLERTKGPGQPFWRDPSFDGLASVLETRGGRPRLRVGHSIVAQALVEAAEVDLVDRTIKLCGACDPANSDERRLIVRLLEKSVADSSLTAQIRSKKEQLVIGVERLLPNASFADAHRLAALLESVGESTLAHKFLAAATPDRVIDRIDVGLALSRKTRQEFNALFSRLIEFYRRNADGPGRRRFVRVARDCGSHEQQVAVGEQTANWSIATHFPTTETLDVLYLSVSSATNEIALKIRPMIEAYLQFDGTSVEILRAAVRSVRRSRDEHLASRLVRRSLDLLNESILDPATTADLARDLTILLPAGLEESQRAAMSEAIVPTLEHLSDRAQLIKTIRAAILLGRPEAIEPVRRSILAVRKRGWREAVQLEQHFRYQYKLEVGGP
ncbi:ATP-binding protein [Acidovorax sp. 106]|uniref:P-loop NTPase n=1 Tax=Acidovorax sp. 106 TaxID=2135637 RepID=UPI0011C3C539|nr:ATP-binding protein [Acidovorax sp. 106]